MTHTVVYCNRRRCNPFSQDTAPLPPDDPLYFSTTAPKTTFSDPIRLPTVFVPDTVLTYKTIINNNKTGFTHWHGFCFILHGFCFILRYFDWVFSCGFCKEPSLARIEVPHPCIYIFPNFSIRMFGPSTYRQQHN